MAGKKKRNHRETVRKGYLQDYEPLADFLVEALERRLRKHLQG